MEFTIDNSGSHFEIAVSGAFDHHKYEELIDTLLTRADWRPETPILVDEIAMEAGKASIETIKACADACTRRRAEFGKARMAIFVARDLEFGMNRMWLTFTSDKWDVSANVFRSRGEAIGWISV
jgi:hypothetical protein